MNQANAPQKKIRGGGREKIDLPSQNRRESKEPRAALLIRRIGEGKKIGCKGHSLKDTKGGGIIRAWKGGFKGKEKRHHSEEKAGKVISD